MSTFTYLLEPSSKLTLIQGVDFAFPNAAWPALIDSKCRSRLIDPIKQRPRATMRSISSILMVGLILGTSSSGLSACVIRHSQESRRCRTEFLGNCHCGPFREAFIDQGPLEVQLDLGG